MSVPVDSILSFNADYLAGVGKTYKGSSENVSVPSGQYTIISSITLPAGTYVVMGNHQWNIDTDQNYIDRITGAGNRAYVTIRASLRGGGGAVTAAIVAIDEETTLNLYTYQTTGTTRIANYILFNAIKIA